MRSVSPSSPADRYCKGVRGFKGEVTRQRFQLNGGKVEPHHVQEAFSTLKPPRGSRNQPFFRILVLDCFCGLDSHHQSILEIPLKYPDDVLLRGGRSVKRIIIINVGRNIPQD